MIEILFLGTGAAVPSRERNTSGIAVRSNRDIVLLDCGEGIQRQLMVSPFSFMKLCGIFISHMHGDHVLGLPGLVQTLGLSGRKEPLHVFGPTGLRKYVEDAVSATDGEVGYELVFTAVEDGGVYRAGCFTATAYATEHGMESFGYVLREDDPPAGIDAEKARSLGISDGPEMAMLKRGETVNGVEPAQVLRERIRGMSVSYTGDTLPCRRTAEASSGVDILIHEATYRASEAANAAEHRHSTATQAAEVARDADARFLILTHISNRYKDRSRLVEDARAVFPETYAADDLCMFSVSRNGIEYRGSD